ncbi:MAG TPA: redoxin domain-containing protein [Acetivibrio saccincola]|uniref:TlpA disulfide reductase family protein n=1 Tax=Acetivibrio saccincola TaxID=1677857 RepID=UPI002D1A19D8|nr:redoxin domain-containing protein [Acetivibrio saccincola]HOA97165.1 redoxin domain-containing protein [Acetivibrio saccincola]HQD28870.1 redoxin domain-containing protein [Acetivibrio saccincola]
MDNKKNENTVDAKKKVIVWLAVLVVLIASSYFIYNYIGDANSVVTDMFFKDKEDKENTKIADNDAGEDARQRDEDVNADENEDINEGTDEGVNEGINKDVNEGANEGINKDVNEDANEDTNKGVNEDVNPNRIKSIDFTLKDFNGDEVSLSDFRGKLVILNFWASWCPPCIAEMPDFDSVNKELKEDDNVVILTVNLTNGYRGETEEVAREFINKNGFTLPVLFDTEGFAAQSYGIRSIPTTYFIDKEGYIIDGISGMVNKDFILKAIETYK